MKEGISLFRVNDIGVLPGIWACREHFNQRIDPEVDEIVTIIEEDNKRKDGSKK